MDIGILVIPFRVPLDRETYPDSFTSSLQWCSREGETFRVGSVTHQLCLISTFVPLEFRKGENSSRFRALNLLSSDHAAEDG